MNRVTIGGRQMPAAVEQRAVDVDPDQPNHVKNHGKLVFALRLGRINRVTIRRL